MTYKIKTEALRLVTEIVKNKLENMGYSLEDNNKRAQDAPSSNTSHSDTTKNQLQTLAVGLTGVLKDLQRDWIYLKGHKVRDCIEDKIGIDSLIHVTDLATKTESAFYVLPGGAGQTITIENTKICIITPKSPLYREIVKADFDDVTFKGKTYSVDEVC